MRARRGGDHVRRPSAGVSRIRFKGCFSTPNGVPLGRAHTRDDGGQTQTWFSVTVQSAAVVLIGAQTMLPVLAALSA